MTTETQSEPQNWYAADFTEQDNDINWLNEIPAVLMFQIAFASRDETRGGWLTCVLHAIVLICSVLVAAAVSYGDLPRIINSFGIYALLSSMTGFVAWDAKQKNTRYESNIRRAAAYLLKHYVAMIASMSLQVPCLGFPRDLPLRISIEFGAIIFCTLVFLKRNPSEASQSVTDSIVIDDFAEASVGHIVDDF